MFTLESIIIMLVVGLIIGFVAEKLMGAKDLGLLWCIVLGIVGSVVGSFVFGLFNITAFGLVGQIVVGIVGACLVLFIVRKLKKA